MSCIPEWSSSASRNLLDAHPFAASVTQTGISVSIARAHDLDQVASVIASAIDTWPAPARLKRRALPVLAYDELDLEDHELVVVEAAGRLVAAGAWQLDAQAGDPRHSPSTLLHGLFVAREAQRSGLGRGLQEIIARRAWAAGFRGLHVKAERFAAGYFAACGYRRLHASEQPGDGATYPYWFWQHCATIDPHLSHTRNNSNHDALRRPNNEDPAS